MKKVIVLCLCVFLFGCINPSLETNQIQKTPENSFTLGTKETEIDYATLIPETNKISEEIKTRYLYFPTDICIDYSTMTVRWVADCGRGINFDLYTDEDQKCFVKLNRSIYKGNLTEIAENSYSSKGEFMPTMLSVNHPISDEVDFYIVVDGNKLYVILEEMETSELLNYRADTYYYAHEYE